ncbi:VOC family protein [Cellvibrio sp. KY-YJ-3]|uniref:VOC family protein n=1 Tax=Cellvibrio sp. KY-YJ-3 TaxID=454662 RepID=UPI00124591C8|nr:VOC family protein [Cellvibrio sp. KY-YJ-3]QEY12023.1 glyoxalase/bleomycin resistance/extradiol dioxygenase family protein [Cellvibrio sp. KY-YJ-3]
MPTQVFINLPVKDLEKSKAFFAHLGYSFNAQFTNEQAACMVISDTIYAMLLTEPFFQGFTKKTIADSHATKEVIICLSCDSRAAVDEMVKKAWEAGGTAPMPAQDHGFMYYHSFEDLDGHHWEVMFMEPDSIQL